MLTRFVRPLDQGKDPGRLEHGDDRRSEILAGSASILPTTITHSHLTPWLSSVYVPGEHRGKGIASAGRAIEFWEGNEFSQQVAKRPFPVRLRGRREGRAIAYFNEAIRLNPKSATAWFARGRLHLFEGSADKAQADFDQASALAPANATIALWADIAARRNKQPGRLAQTTSDIDMAAWPAPVVKLFLNQMTSADVLAAADNPDASKKSGQICEANFYGGEFALTKGAKEEAIRLFRLAASECPHGYLEWDGAVAELKLLGAGP